VAGTVSVVSSVTGIYDKGSGALVASQSQASDAATGEPLVTSRSGLFIRGEGGWGGDRGPASRWQVPDREPDCQIVLQTRPEQALLYRLSGDRNPLHADPQFAARGGFERPILHGLCTYGFTGRALLHALCDGDPARFRAMSGRFSSPVLPGDSLVVSIWNGDRDAAGGDPAASGTARFRTTRKDGTVVIDRGEMQFGPPAS
jgi:acyl dehydratase